MSFDRSTRNALASMVGKARERLRIDVADQLRGLGFQPGGAVLDLERIASLSEAERAAGEELRELLEHFVAAESGGEVESRVAAYDRLVREIGFTIYNRLVALRMAEERGLIVQSVSGGLASAGFQLYERIANGGLGDRHDTYRAYLQCLYDELGRDLPALFDSTTPESRIFPTERCLEDLFALLDDRGLAHLWKEDETIGWVYQYYNDPDERKKMREASQAPRSSRELAVRNQFFTPRYVVEFLTDNTLGRLWYEMRQGNTGLIDRCPYLVRRPAEVFLAEGQGLPSGETDPDHVATDKPVNHPVYVPFRARKDPRDLKILDPACGSGHFLLYCFDLLGIIYEETWEDEHGPVSLTTGRNLREDYPSLERLRAALPTLILRHNLHGMEIDPRAAQIAGLALWLQAQRSYQRLGLKSTDRPPLTRGNIVVAEPMPGEASMLNQFARRLDSPLLRSLVESVFSQMRLAGEVGSLLKVEEALRDAIREAKALWLQAPRAQQLALIPELAQTPAEQLELSDLSGITDEAFWEQVEERVFIALEEYATEAAAESATRRLLFAEDAIRGFAFVDLCRTRYDVILMNPPFGLPTPTSYQYLVRSFPASYSDLSIAMMTRGLRMLTTDGLTGSISSRAFLMVTDAERFRRAICVPVLEHLADLGTGVMDDALVDASAQIMRETPLCRHIGFIDLRDENDKARGLLDFQSLTSSARCYYRNRDAFQLIPGCRLAYDQTPQIAALMTVTDDGIDPVAADARIGASTFDDERFLRLRWEVNGRDIGRDRMWCLTAKSAAEFSYQTLTLMS